MYCQCQISHKRRKKECLGKFKFSQNLKKRCDMKLTRLRLCLGACESWIISNLTWKIINRKTLPRLCKYIIVILEYFVTTTNTLFNGKFQKFLNSTWRLKISLSQRPLTKKRNRLYLRILKNFLLINKAVTVLLVLWY
jgi:hypothetical protein